MKLHTTPFSLLILVGFILQSNSARGGDAIGFGVNFSITPFSNNLSTNVVKLVLNRSCWNYWDRGTYPGRNWAEPGFDDQTWSTGYGEFGYGSIGETTVLNYGPDANHKYITSYFRHTFSVFDGSQFTNLVLHLKRDDGAVVYLNGLEAYRNNLPAGPIGYSTLATVESQDGDTFQTIHLNLELLVSGENTLAVEIHQNSNSGPDVHFDCELVAEVSTPATPRPTLSITRQGDKLTLSWPDSTAPEFILQQGNGLNRTNAWTNVLGRIAKLGGKYVFTNTLQSPQKYFRLCAPICQPPLVLVKPVPTVAALGQTATLSVIVAGTGPLTYQWFHNTYPIPGANASSLVLTNLQRTNGGSYDVCINGLCGFTFTRPVALTVGGQNAIAADNLVSATVLTGTNGSVNASNTLATAELGEPTHARRSATHSIWFSLTAPATGIIEIGTDGSSFDTVLAVYRGTNVTALERVAEDDDGGMEYRSRVRFSAVSGAIFSIAVDSFNDKTGVVQLDWHETPGPANLPTIYQQPQDLLVGAGGTAIFSVGASNYTSLQWYHAGIAIPGATNSVLTITNVSEINAGSYQVVASNGLNSVKSVLAQLSILSGTGYTIGVDGFSKRTKCNFSYNYLAILNDPANPPSLCLIPTVNWPFAVGVYNNAVSHTLISATINAKYCCTGTTKCVANCVKINRPSNACANEIAIGQYSFEILVNTVNTTTVYVEFK